MIWLILILSFLLITVSAILELAAFGVLATSHTVSSDERGLAYILVFAIPVIYIILQITLITVPILKSKANQKS